MDNTKTESSLNFRQQLQLELEHRDTFSMRRQLRTIQGSGRLVKHQNKSLINLASNDYLALASHPHLKEAAINATLKYGTGSGASKIVTGHLDIHHEVETKFAAFKHSQSALLFPTGYAANLAVLTSLAAPGDLICLDKLSHTSLIDASNASGATVRAFPTSKQTSSTSSSAAIRANPHPTAPTSPPHPLRQPTNPSTVPHAALSS